MFEETSARLLAFTFYNPGVDWRLVYVEDPESCFVDPGADVLELSARGKALVTRLREKYGLLVKEFGFYIGSAGPSYFFVNGHLYAAEFVKPLHIAKTEKPVTRAIWVGFRRGSFFLLQKILPFKDEAKEPVFRRDW